MRSYFKFGWQRFSLIFISDRHFRMLFRHITALLILVLLAGCQTTSVNTSYHSNYAHFEKNGVVANATKSASKDEHKDLWQLTRAKLAFNQDYKQSRVLKEIKYFNRYPLHMTKVSEQAAPYYHYVLQEVLKRDLPSEVALLPVIESLYDPSAYSYGKASGIWQFIPSTATYLGLDINQWYDGRRDIISSTQTALDYLEQLNKRFDGDWMLTFAAYNGGGGTVSKAIRKNKKKGLATDYWSLKLPKETTHYVPRLLAIAALVENPTKYKIELPSIPNTPYFKVVKTQGQVHLANVAKLANVHKKTIEKLNPGFNRTVTGPAGPHRILVPVENAARLTLALKSIDRTQSISHKSYTIKAGDSLGLIAQRFGITTSTLKQTNSLTSSKIRIGKTLLIPTIKNSTANIAVLARKAKIQKPHKTHKINNGDTVWDIAKKHKLSVKDILAFNGLSKNSTLKIGSELKIPRG